MLNRTGQDVCTPPYLGKPLRNFGISLTSTTQRGLRMLDFFGLLANVTSIIIDGHRRGGWARCHWYFYHNIALQLRIHPAWPVTSRHGAVTKLCDSPSLSNFLRCLRDLSEKLSSSRFLNLWKELIVGAAPWKWDQSSKPWNFTF